MSFISLFGFGQAGPAHLGQFLIVADEHVDAVRRLGRHVDHGAPGRRVRTAADDPARLGAKASFLLDLPHGGVDRALAGFDIARDEGPRRLVVLALGDQDAQVAGHDGHDHWAGLGSGGRLSLALEAVKSLLLDCAHYLDAVYMTCCAIARAYPEHAAAVAHEIKYSSANRE